MKLDMTKEEIISEAVIAYNNCRLIINSLNSLAKMINEEFDTSKSFCQFDMLLQALLFSQAIADGDFCKEEKEFILKLTTENNLFDHIETEKLGELSWDKVFELSNDEQQELSLEINEFLNKVADEFVIPFAILDAGTTQNTLLDLSDALATISLLLGAVDGEVTEDEIDAFSMYADELIIGKWADVKGLTLMMMEDEEGADEDADSEAPADSSDSSN